jgi:hypothetical protein
MIRCTDLGMIVRGLIDDHGWVGVRLVGGGVLPRPVRDEDVGEGGDGGCTVVFGEGGDQSAIATRSSSDKNRGEMVRGGCVIGG